MSFSEIRILLPVGSNGSNLMLEANPHRPSLRLHPLRGKLDGLHPVSIKEPVTRSTAYLRRF
jgi:hypothetical protein